VGPTACLWVQQPARPSDSAQGTSLSVLALFKNEGDILWEWSRHYLDQGATQIILVNNNSSDDWRGALGELGQDRRIICLEDPRLQAQERIYNDVRRSGLISGDWLLVCDLDEFIYARPPFPSISAYLSQLTPEITSVAIPWKLFGSSGHIRHPDGRTIDNFLQRKRAGEPVLIKTISRTAALQHLWPHHSRLSHGRCIRPDGSEALQETAGWMASSEESLQREALHLNHYAVRSREFFERVKATRGDVYSRGNVRDDAYFARFDHNELHDDELHQLSAVWAPAEPRLSWFAAERPAAPPGPRAPVFRLLHTAPCLHHKPGQARPAIEGCWHLQARETDGSSVAIDGGLVPRQREQLVQLLPRLAPILSLSLDRRLPLHLDMHGSKPQVRQSLQQWLALLGNPHPVVWNPGGAAAAAARLSLNHTHACDAWQTLAQRLAANRRVQQAWQRSTSTVPIVLAPSKGRSRWERRLNRQLHQVGQELQLPMVKLWQLSPLKQLLVFRRSRWLVGPYQPSLQLVHAVEALPGARGTLVLLCPSRHQKATLAQMELVAANPHRLLLLPQSDLAGSLRWLAEA